MLAVVEGGKWWGKGARMMNTVQIHIHMYINASKCKMTPIETIPGIGREDEGEQWRG
jgi:hypothetical protein